MVYKIVFTRQESFWRHSRGGGTVGRAPPDNQETMSGIARPTNRVSSMPIPYGGMERNNSLFRWTHCYRSPGRSGSARRSRNDVGHSPTYQSCIFDATPHGGVERNNQLFRWTHCYRSAGRSGYARHRLLDRLPYLIFDANAGRQIHSKMSPSLQLLMKQF
jgi:hypothetical protein